VESEKWKVKVEAAAALDAAALLIGVIGHWTDGTEVTDGTHVLLV
jgi:hypothetical protein